MINKFKDYDTIDTNESISLETGGYELKIINAKVENYSTCSILKIAFDIVNDPKYSGFYSKRFKANQAKNPNAKWGGVFDVFIPKDDGSDRDYYTKLNFKRFTTAVEQSNSGYKWNWDETSLKNKVFGGVFGREEFETSDKKRKFAVKCRFARSIESIKSGDFTIPDDKLLGQKSQEQQNPLAEYEEILGSDDSVLFL